MRELYYRMHFICVLLLLHLGCALDGEESGTAWVLTATEETKGGGQKQTFSDQRGRTRVLRTDSEGHVKQEVIRRQGQVISDLGWHTDGSRQHEIRYEGKKRIRNVSWHPNGKKHREYIHKNGVCVLNRVWYLSGQLAEENVYDKDGKYLAAPRWYPNGQLKYEAEFRNGQAVKRTWYGEDGTIDRVEEDDTQQDKSRGASQGASQSFAGSDIKIAIST